MARVWTAAPQENRNVVLWCLNVCEEHRLMRRTLKTEKMLEDTGENYLLRGLIIFTLHEIFIRLTKDVERGGLCGTPKTKENLTKFDTYHWDNLK